jgi:FAD:protein FMN transferase
MSQTFTFEAIGTHWWTEIFDDISDEELEGTKSHPKLPKAPLELLCSQFNQTYSRFRSDSLISVLNERRVLENPPAELVNLLTCGKQLYLRSGTTFNFLTGHILEARGYDASYSFIPKETEPQGVCNPLTDLEISEEKIILHCGKIDIGGFGKGWLIDKLKDDLLAHNVEHFLINGGGDMYATSDLNNQAITIYLEHPTEVGKYLQETTIKNQGFAASSPFKRNWKHHDKEYDHIVTDGETPKLAVFVKASTATEADAFTKPCLLLDQDGLLDTTAREGVAFARFDPLTGELWQTTNFF